ncbi:VCBS repeat-containing protein [Bremerella sp. JC770]|uniref:FG-GAP repeat domain-containing protein n=1 Tax=Bremerella sp. JC770 TaxID=3232137 RepID=UPI00345B2204
MFARLLLLSPALLLGLGSLSAEDLQSTNFEKIRLTEEYYAEGASVGDFNQDGKTDIVCGPHWFAGPDFQAKHTFYDGKAFPNDRGYSDNFFSFVDDFNGDGFDDVLVVGLPGTPAHWYANSKSGEPWKKHFAFPAVDNEAPAFLDITGDGNPELICHFEGQLGYASTSEKDPTQRWVWTPISEKQGWGRYQHGLGVGDINGDGRPDFLMPEGWWEQPASWDGTTPWKKHAYRFAPGGAGIHAYDLDGDGDNDVVTSLHGHRYGLVWHEQTQGENGEIEFTQHEIMGTPEKSVSELIFSQLHAVEMADMNGDGVQDIVTGKCYWAHNGKDPGAKDPAVLAIFQTSRTGDRKVSFKPVRVDDNSGTGRQITLCDVNNDGKNDIVAGNKKGTFLFLAK